MPAPERIPEKNFISPASDGWAAISSDSFLIMPKASASSSFRFFLISFSARSRALRSSGLSFSSYSFRTSPSTSTFPSIIFLTRFSISASIAGEALSLFNPHSPKRSLSFCLIQTFAPSPVTASILLMPLATELSAVIFIMPIADVFSTCVPPQSSLDSPLMATTRTVSPYFSPKKESAPSAFASLSDLVSVETGMAFCIQPFTISSTLPSSLADILRMCVKSNLRCSASTRDPDCFTCSPSTCRSADWRRCVAV